MRPEELEYELTKRPPGFVPKPLPPEPPPRPMEALVGEVLRMAERAPQSAAPGIVEQRRERSAQIRRRLPEMMWRDGPLPVQPDEVLSRVKDQRIVAAVRAARWGGPGLVLLGATGSGKSSAAAWLFRRLLWEGVHGSEALWARAQCLRWFNADELALARGHHRMGQGEAPEIIKAAAASFLVIDDAGWDRDPAAVSEVLRQRYEGMRPTVITSGMTRKELVLRYGDAVMRRLVEEGGRRSVLVDCHPKGP